MNPCVSVITVCRNALQGLNKTADSVLSQSAENFEWIIVDGASEDGTRNFLEALEKPWINWISEADTGIYDAMNKGLAMARGNWVWFMNAGDRFYDKHTLGLLNNVDDSVEICFGESLVFDSVGKELGPRSSVTPHTLPSNLEKLQFRHGMVVSHQAFAVRRSLAPRYTDKRYKYSADLDWLLTILSKPRKSLNLGTLARIDREGATLQNWRQSQWERFLILAGHFGRLATIKNHFTILGRRLVHGKRTNLWK